MICGVCKSEAIDLVHAHPPYGLRCLEAQLAQAKSEIERLQKIKNNLIAYMPQEILIRMLKDSEAANRKRS